MIATAPLSLDTENFTYLRLSNDPRPIAQALARVLKETVQTELTPILTNANLLVPPHRVTQYSPEKKIQEMTLAKDKVPKEGEPTELEAWNLVHWHGFPLCEYKDMHLFVRTDGVLFTYSRAAHSDLWLCGCDNKAWQVFPAKILLPALSRTRCYIDAMLRTVAMGDERLPADVAKIGKYLFDRSWERD